MMLLVCVVFRVGFRCFGFDWLLLFFEQQPVVVPKCSGVGSAHTHSTHSAAALPPAGLVGVSAASSAKLAFSAPLLPGCLVDILFCGLDWFGLVGLVDGGF